MGITFSLSQSVAMEKLPEIYKNNIIEVILQGRMKAAWCSFQQKDLFFSFKPERRFTLSKNQNQAN